MPALSFAEPSVAESTLIDEAEMVDEGKGKSTEELARAAQNPIASMISLPFQNNTNLNIGPNDQTQNIIKNSEFLHSASRLYCVIILKYKIISGGIK